MAFEDDIVNIEMFVNVRLDRMIKKEIKVFFIRAMQMLYEIYNENAI